MANCHELFIDYNNVIRLAKTYRSSLRTSRDALREKVRAKFKTNGYDVKFHEQGSFAMGTIIKPAGGEYDIDDGIYLIQEETPAVTIATLHRWVYEAAEDHTQQAPSDRGPCVRVFFASDYHIDLVVYHKPPQSTPRLAHKPRGWLDSDPKQFNDWFKGEAGTGKQLKRLVRYFKGWKDNLKGDMPSGLILTILATKHSVFDERDDVAFLETVKSIRTQLKLAFACYRPTFPQEDLFADYSETRKRYFLERLDGIIDSGEKALAADTQKDACTRWKRHLGERFPCYNASEELEEAKRFEVPAFIRSDSRSAHAVPIHGEE